MAAEQQGVRPNTIPVGVLRASAPCIACYRVVVGPTNVEVSVLRKRAGWLPVALSVSFILLSVIPSSILLSVIPSSIASGQEVKTSAAGVEWMHNETGIDIAGIRSALKANQIPLSVRDDF